MPREKLSAMAGIRWATAPVQPRCGALLWGGIALFFAAGGASALFDVPPILMPALYVGMLAGWIVGAAGMVGMVRLLYAQSAAEMRKVQSERMKD